MPRKKICRATGVWIDIKSHQTDPGLRDFLVETFKGTEDKWFDFGCGDASYAKALMETGVDFDCYDGSPLTPELTGGVGKLLNLTSDFDFEPRDWTLCLEVGEHVPKPFEDKLVNNLVKHTKKGIILSWAVPGQRGSGHVNLQDNQYVRDVMASHDFHTDQELEDKLRASVSDYKYFTWTLMAFRRSG